MTDTYPVIYLNFQSGVYYVEGAYYALADVVRQAPGVGAGGEISVGAGGLECDPSFDGANIDAPPLMGSFPEATPLIVDAINTLLAGGFDPVCVVYYTVGAAAKDYNFFGALTITGPPANPEFGYNTIGTGFTAYVPPGFPHDAPPYIYTAYIYGTNYTPPHINAGSLADVQGFGLQVQAAVGASGFSNGNNANLFASTPSPTLQISNISFSAWGSEFTESGPYPIPNPYGIDVGHVRLFAVYKTSDSPTFWSGGGAPGPPPPPPPPGVPVYSSTLPTRIPVPIPCVPCCATQMPICKCDQANSASIASHSSANSPSNSSRDNSPSIQEIGYGALSGISSNISPAKCERGIVSTSPRSGAQL